MPTIEASIAVAKDYSISALLGGRGLNWPINPVKPVKNRSTKFDKSKAKLEFRIDSLGNDKVLFLYLRIVIPFPEGILHI